MRTSGLLALNPGDGKARELRLGKREITVGSDQGNDLTVLGGGVSRRHAVIRYRAGRYELLELNSTNGTFVNNKRIVASTLLKDGDEIRFGAARFTFLDRKEPRPSPTQNTHRRRRLGLRAWIALLVILFLLGFAVAEYSINRHYIKWPPVGTSPNDSADRSISVARSGANQWTVAPAVPGVATRVAQPDWLARVNYYRALAKLSPVVENLTLSRGDLKHARYLVENYSDVIHSGGELGAAMHSEEETNPWYSPEGFAAAHSSDVYEGCGNLSSAGQVDGWVTGPFHRLAILNPNLDAAGYGRFENGGCWGAVLDLPQAPRPSPNDAQAVMFPPDQATISLRDFDGREWPDPLASCPDYSPPVGLPITLQMGRRMTPRIGDHSISTEGRTVEHCAFDFASYRNANMAEQNRVSAILQEFGAIILIPREPLIVGNTYQVSIAANGKSYNWSFIVGN
jgi:uncharacterized protein YkwD